MKFVFFCLLLIASLIFSTFFVSAEVSVSERSLLKNQVDKIINNANDGDFSAINDLLSPNSREGLTSQNME